MAESSGTITLSDPSFTLIGSSTAPMATSAGEAAHVVPVYTLSGSSIAPMGIGSGKINEIITENELMLFESKIQKTIAKKSLKTEYIVIRSSVENRLVLISPFQDNIEKKSALEYSIKFMSKIK
jgi:hypothetical protein